MQSWSRGFFTSVFKTCAAQKNKISIKRFLQFLRFLLRIWSHLLNKYLMESSIFCAVSVKHFTIKKEVKGYGDYKILKKKRVNSTISRFWWGACQICLSWYSLDMQSTIISSIGSIYVQIHKSSITLEERKPFCCWKAFMKDISRKDTINCKEIFLPEDDFVKN